MAKGMVLGRVRNMNGHLLHQCSSSRGRDAKTRGCRENTGGTGAGRTEPRSPTGYGDER